MRLILRYFFTFGSSVLQHFGGGVVVLGCGMWSRAAPKCLSAFFFVHTELPQLLDLFIEFFVFSSSNSGHDREKRNFDFDFNKKPCVRKIVRQAGGIVFCFQGPTSNRKTLSTFLPWFPCFGVTPPFVPKICPYHQCGGGGRGIV